MELSKEPSAPLFILGNYQILKSIATGGMGDIFLAYDTACRRYVALKKLKINHLQSSSHRQQFIDEAYMTSRLTHPAIVPIYSIVESTESIYYTMPYIDGMTLKEILNNAEQQLCGEESNIPFSDVSSLVHIFLSICRGVAYAHSKGLLHCDLKPSNIIIGPFGDPVILDWGLVQSIANEAKRGLHAEGKIAGTIAYLAPEALQGVPGSFQSEIYSLGLLFYEMLTLRHPFHRSNLQQYKESLSKEVLLDPCKVAPFRDIPEVLSYIALKCLTEDLEKRYPSLQCLTDDLENYCRNSGWFHLLDLDVQDASQWINENRQLQISAQDFGDDLAIKVDLVGKSAFKLLIGVDKEGNGGYAVLIDALFSRLELFYNGKLQACCELDPVGDGKMQLYLEKVKGNLFIYIKGRLELSYLSYLPQRGGYVGISGYRDSEVLGTLSLSSSAQNYRYNLNMEPNVFLKEGLYDMALKGYRKIAEKHPWSTEGAEALFRAGIVLLECADRAKDESEKNRCLQMAFEEFGRLHDSSGGPLEFLGKALVSKKRHDSEREVLYFKEGFERYPKNPFRAALERQVISNMQNPSSETALLQLYFLALYYFPHNVHIQSRMTEVVDVVDRMPLYFICDSGSDRWPQPFDRYAVLVRLAFLLGKTDALKKIIEDSLNNMTGHLSTLGNALFALIELEEEEYVEYKVNSLKQQTNLDVQALAHLDWINETIRVKRAIGKDLSNVFFSELPQVLEKESLRTVFISFSCALDHFQTSPIYSGCLKLEKFKISAGLRSWLDSFHIWAYLCDKNWTEAESLIEKYPGSLEGDLPFLRGCLIAARQGKKAAVSYFAQLPSGFNTRFLHLLSQDNMLLSFSFTWQKQQFLRQQALFNYCLASA